MLHWLKFRPQISGALLENVISSSKLLGKMAITPKRIPHVVLVFDLQLLYTRETLNREES